MSRELSRYLDDQKLERLICGSCFTIIFVIDSLSSPVEEFKCCRFMSIKTRKLFRKLKDTMDFSRGVNSPKKLIFVIELQCA